MHDFHFLGDILVLLGAAVVLVYLFDRLRASHVLGYLVAGLLIGPKASGLITDVKGIQTLAELGVVFLLFSIGLELSFKRLAQLRKEVFGLGGSQIILTGGIVALFVWALDVPLVAAVVIGSGVALSSTAIVLQLLAERGELSSRMGRNTFSILLMQDIAIVPLLAMVPLLGGGQGGATDWYAIGIAVAKAAGALVAIVVIGRLVLAPMFRAIAGLKRQEIFIAIILVCVLGTAYATEEVGLSLTMGAFLAGLMMAETEFRHQIEVDIRPIQSLLLGLFFMTVGMNVDLAYALKNWWQVILLVLGLVVLKTAIIVALARWMIKVPLPLAVRSGFVLAQGGEFAFVLLAVAVGDNIVPPAASQMTYVVVSLSMALTPFLNLLGRKAATLLEREVQIGLAALEEESKDLQGHVIIAGYGRFGQIIGRILDEHRIPYVAVENDPQVVAAAKEKGLPVHFGDTLRPEFLWGLGIERASALISTVDVKPQELVSAIRRLHDLLPDLTIIARARDEDHAAALKEAGASAAVPDMLASSLHLAQSVMRRFELPDKDLPKLIEDYRRAA